MAALLDEDDTFIDIPGMCSLITVLLYLDKAAGVLVVIKIAKIHLLFLYYVNFELL